jgi:vacuolar-type H+-ATPase subunit I/STV1
VPDDALADQRARAGRNAAAQLKAAQDADPAYAGLSKNARKKLARKQASGETDWKARKRQKKEQKRVRSAEEGEKARGALALLSEEEREQLRLAAWERRKAEDAKAAAWRKNIQSTPFRCVIDLGFEEQMHEREVKSLVQQVRRFCWFLYHSFADGTLRSRRGWRRCSTAMGPTAKQSCRGRST